LDAVSEVAKDAVHALGELLEALLHAVAATGVVGRVRDGLRGDDEEAGVARPLEVAADALGRRMLLAAVLAQVVAQVERVGAADAEPAGRAAGRVVHVDGHAVAPDRVGEEDAGRRRSGRLPARALAVQEGVDLLRGAHAPERLERRLLTLPKVPPERPLDCVTEVASEHDRALAEARAGCRLVLVLLHRRRDDVRHVGRRYLGGRRRRLRRGEASVM